MFLAKIAINRPVMTTMGILVFILFGVLAFRALKVNQTPEVKIPYVTVFTVYPGAGPKEIETQISKKLEDAIATVSEIKRLESYSLDGVSIVMIEFDMGKDVDVANQEVKDKVDQILNELPDDAELPVIQKVDLQAFPIVDIVLSGNLSPTELYELADKTLKDRFSQIKGVGRVDITGGQEREIHVVLDDKIVFQNNISLPQLLGVLKAHNMDIPGGYIQQKDQEYTVRLEGKYPDLKTLRELEVHTPFGPKKIRQFAEVLDTGKNVREKAIFYSNITRVRDENVVRISLVKSSEGNAVDIAENVLKALPEIQDILPEGAKLEMVNDASIFIRSTVDDTLSNIYLGIFFTSIVLLIFLHDLRSTIIIALSMPTSIISTFILLQFAGFSLNMMSLMGLSVSVGVLVANSVIVLENIFRHKGMGNSNKQASYKGTAEVTVAVLAATLTNIIVFLPIANIGSIVGEFLRELALTAAFSTIFSLIMSFTLTPMLASLLLPKEQKVGRISKMIIKFELMWENLYKRSLAFILNNGWYSLGVSLLSFIILIFVMAVYAPKIGFEFMPVIDHGKIGVYVEMPQGTNLAETENVLNQVEDKLKSFKEVKHIVTNLGMTSELDIGTNLARMDVHLVDANARNTGIQDMITIFIKELSKIPNARIKVQILESMGGGESPIEFYLLGQDLATLEIYKDTVWNKIKNIPGLINLDNSSKSGKPELTVYPIRERLNETGLTVMDLAMTLRSSLEGIVSSQYKEFGNEYDIKITLDDNIFDSPDKIRNIPIVSPTGTYRLSQIADIQFTSGYTKVLHRDKYLTIKFTGSPAEGTPLGNVVDEITKRTADIDFPSGYRVSWGGSTEMFQKMQIDMLTAFLIAFILTYMLLAAILESFWQPVIILITLPLSFIGVFLALYYTNTTMNLTSMMGIIMLIGIVVNNAILILDYTNQLRMEKGLNMKDALIEAAPTKLKAIIMSTTAIILGMLPMALGIGDAGKEMRIPLGVVSIGGLVASTFLTLYVIPSFNLLSDKFGNMIKRILKIKSTGIVEKV